MSLADHLTIENLLRSWLRETGRTQPDDEGVLRIDLPVVGTRIEADVIYWSATGLHRFASVRLPGGARVDASTLAGLLGRELAVGRGRTDAQVADLVTRVRDSVRRTAEHIEARRLDPDPADQAVDRAGHQAGHQAGHRAGTGSDGKTGFGPGPYLLAEQALLQGHLFHPAPKARVPLSPGEARRYSPELRGRFPLHWFAADPAVVASDSALDAGAEEILRELAGPDLPLPDGTVALPAHPWQAREVCLRPGIQRLLASGELRDLGPAGPAWYPTSSLRTVYRPNAGYQLKLSLGLPITNSKRELLGKELRRGVEVHRLLEAGLGKELAAAHPGFDIVRDPAWLAIDGARGLEVDIRLVAGPPTERIECLAGLIAEQPDGSRLARLHADLRRAVGSRRAIGPEWFERYLYAVVVPILWLYAEHGIALEAHQQNTLVSLDDVGWPVGGAYRDNQGFYLAESRAAHVGQWLPDAGRDGEWICADPLVEERLGYYLGINNVLGLIGAMGAQSLAEEPELLRVLSRVLSGVGGPAGELTLVTRLLDAPTLRCKANLLTRVDGLDELVGPVETQSVYVDVPNPLAAARAAGGTEQPSPATSGGLP